MLFRGVLRLYWSYLGHGVGAWPVEPVDRAAHTELRHCEWLRLGVGSCQSVL